jgi:hypothetical protein
MGRPVLAAVRALTLAAGFCATTVGAAAAAPDEGRLVHVADTRSLHGFNLYIANLYNTDRLLFTLLAIALTAALGLTLGVLMDAVVASIGLDIRRREFKE